MKIYDTPFSVSKSLLILLLYICGCFKIVADQTDWRVTEHLLINDGLSNNYVRDMVLDSNGRLWIATDSGLDSFDGVEFYSFNKANTQLPANMINCIWYDNDRHHLWVGTKGIGLFCLDTENGEQQVVNSPDSVLANVLSICRSSEDFLWLISSENVARLNLKTEQISVIDISTEGHNFRCGIDDGNGNLLLGTHTNGAFMYQAHSGLVEPLSFPGEDSERIKVNEMIRDIFGRIWISTNKGIWRYRHGDQNLVPFPEESSTEIFHFCVVDEKELWYTTSRSIGIIDLKTEQVHTLSINEDQSMLWDIQSIYQDPFGNIWIGENGNGIKFLSHQHEFFRKMHDGSFWGIYLDNDITWVGSRNYILGFKGTELVDKVDVTSNNRFTGGVLSINGDGSDILYLAVPYHFLQYNKRTKEVKEIKTIKGRSIEALTFYKDDTDNVLWVTASDGVYTYRDGELKEMAEINRILNNQSANGIRRDKEGKLWVATYENGIYLFDSYYHLITNLNQHSGFISNSVQHLKFDSQGRLWMSTPDGPCCIPDTNYPMQYVMYGYAEGLSDTYVRAIQEDMNGNIWMSTNNGISMLRSSDNTIINYNQKDYLSVNNFIGGAVMQADGGLIFNSLEGLCYVNPVELTKERSPLNVRVLSIQTYALAETGREVDWHLPNKKGEYHLAYDNSTFQIIFGSEDYSECRQLEYEYQINKEKGQWLPCSRGYVLFRNFQPGEYDIRIRYRFKGQPWNSQNILSAKVIVDSPWWSSLWAKCIYWLLFMLLMGIFLMHYLHRIRLSAELELERQKNLEEQKLNNERLQFFTNITHELKTPLTLIQAPLEELLNEFKLKEHEKKVIKLVYDSSMRLSDLCNKLLDFRKTETHIQHLQARLGRLDLFIKDIGESFIELNVNPALQVRMEIESPMVPLLFDTEVIRSIVTNLLSNSMKYTQQGEVVLRLQTLKQDGQNTILLQVKDTGHGIPKEALPRIFDRYYQVKGPHQASGTGIGLSIVHSLVQLHGAEIVAESEVGQGTTMSVYFKNLYPQIQEQDTLETTSDVDSRPVLLLVEDDTQILRFMAEALGNDYLILTASNGQKGLDIALSKIPDIVITDLMMPIMDGETLCRRLKSDLRTSHIPVVMLTAKDTREDQCQGYESGADSYLTKPFSLQMLRAVLLNILHSKEKLIAWINAQRMATVMSVNGVDRGVEMKHIDKNQQLSTFDQNFLNEVESYIVNHLSDDVIKMEDLALSMRMSHSTLYRKIKALTGLTVSEHVRKIRVLQSAKLMLSGKYNISEAAYKCGFSNLSYFRNSFKEILGMTPSEYQKNRIETS